MHILEYIIKVDQIRMMALMIEIVNMLMGALLNSEFP
jgi:hypothetical protein